MASVRPYRTGFRCEVYVTTPAGVVKDNKTFATRSEAEQWGAAREREIKAVRDGGFPERTVRQLLERWRDEVAPTRDGQKWDINRINAILVRWDGFGFTGMQLRDFRSIHMAKVRKARLAEISAPSVAREEALLKTIWAAARHPEWAWTDVDPFKDLGPIRGSKGQPRKRSGQWQEIRRILRQLGYHPRRETTSISAEVGLSMMLALRTTLRSQEVLQLGDDCINLQRMVATIPQHKTRYVTQAPKSVPILPKALLLLARKCIGRGRYFRVKPASRDTLYRKAKILAGVETLTFHDLKRTSIRLLKSRLTENEMMSVTGNSDVEVLRRHYMMDTAADASKAAWGALGFDQDRILRTTGLAASASTGS